MHTAAMPKGKMIPGVRGRSKSKTDLAVDSVVGFYLESGDFNGMPGALLGEILGPRWRGTVRSLVVAGRLEVLTSRIALNPHVKRLRVPDVEDQIAALRRSGVSDSVCVYPHPSVLDERVDRHAYIGERFSLSLALGSPQLEPRAFDLRILETYRSDPRYTYECDDIHGSLCISDEYYKLDEFRERDKVMMQAFGFGFDEKLGRAVMAFTCDLARLSPEHQSVWSAHELPATDFRMHPDFFRTQILGEFPEQIPICQAFFMELETMNEMANAMGRPDLFRTTVRPKRFGLLLSPTQYEFEQFVHLLDKVMSDNIRREFFGKDVIFERETTRSDGKVRVDQKGTVQLLGEWIEMKVKLIDPGPFDEMMAVFREVRKLRQVPAHTVTVDVFDQEIFRRQRSLLVRAYRSVRTLRLILANHPAASIVQVDPFLFAGKINSF